MADTYEENGPRHLAGSRKTSSTSESDVESESDSLSWSSASGNHRRRKMSVVSMPSIPPPSPSRASIELKLSQSAPSSPFFRYQVEGTEPHYFDLEGGHQVLASLTPRIITMDTTLTLPEAADEGAASMDSLMPPESEVQRKESASSAIFAGLLDAERLRKISSADQSDFVRLKDMISTLNLNPRRSSTMEWRSRLPASSLPDTRERLASIDEHGQTTDSASVQVAAGESGLELSTPEASTKRMSVVEREELLDSIHSPLSRFSDTMKRHLTTDERKQHIAHALLLLKQELSEMRESDYTLAKQLLRLRQEINHVRLHKCYVENKELLADAIDEEAEKDEDYALKLSDLPPRLFSPELKQIGLTPMNISTRRFSVF